MKNENMLIVFTTENPEEDRIIQTQDPEIVALAMLTGAQQSEYDDDVLLMLSEQQLINFAKDNHLVVTDSYGVAQ